MKFLDIPHLEGTSVYNIAKRCKYAGTFQLTIQK